MQHGLRQQFVSELKKTCALELQRGTACSSRGEREKHFPPLPHSVLHITSETASFSASPLHALPHFHPRVQVFAVTQIAATISAACESESASPNSSVRLKKFLMAPPCPGLNLQPQYPTLNRHLLKEHMQKGHVQEVHVLNVLSDGSP